MGSYLNIQSEEAGLTEVSDDEARGDVAEAEVHQLRGRVRLRELEVHRERQGTDQEAEQQGHFETVLGVDRAGGQEEQAEDDGAERHGAGEEDVPVGRAHSREVDSPDEADDQEVDQTQLEPAQSLDELTMSNFFPILI